MIRMKIRALPAFVVLGLVACGSDQASDTAVVTETDVVESVSVGSPKQSKEEFDGMVAKPGSPYSISYRIIGTPVVGSPVTVDLRVESLRGSRPLNLDYRIGDETSMLFAASQPVSIRLELAANEKEFRQQVTIIPQREGRFYLNVSVSYESENGTISTVMAIPIQVGTGTRELQEHGEVQLDENDEEIRVLGGDT